MSDYYATARSSYYKVKDKTKFKKFCQKYELEYIEKEDDKSKVGFLVNESPRNGAIPNGYTNKKGDFVETDFEGELSEHLVKGEIVVVMEVGNQKMCFLSGYAVAIHSSGKTVTVSLSDIYELAAKKFRVKKESIEPAEY